MPGGWYLPACTRIQGDGPSPRTARAAAVGAGCAPRVHLRGPPRILPAIHGYGATTRLKARWREARMALWKEIDGSIAAEAEFEYVCIKPHEARKVA